MGRLRRAGRRVARTRSPKLGSSGVVLALIAWIAAGCGPLDDERMNLPPLGQEDRLRLVLGPEQIEARRDEAIRHMQQRRFEAAADALRPVVSRPSVEPGVLFLYGKALLRSGRPSLGLWALARAAEGAPAGSEVAWLHAEALLQGGDPENAVRELDRLIELAPDVPRLVRLRAQANARLLRFEQAIEDLGRLAELDPGDFGALDHRIEMLSERGRIDEARAAIADLRERLERAGAPAAVQGRFCASSALFEHRQGEVERARRRFDACLAEHPGEPDVVLPWLIHLDDLGEHEAATSALVAALAGPGRSRLRLWLALGERHALRGRRAEAAEVLERAATQMKVPQPLFALADHRVAWGDLEGARDAVDRAITMQVGRSPGAPDFRWSSLPAQGRFMFGDILIRAGDFERAETIIESLEAEQEQEQGEAVYPLLLRARLALERDDPTAALDYFEESFRYWPSNVTARYLAGQAALLRGEITRAMGLIQDAFRADPAASDAGLVLARMQAAQGLLGSAADSLSTLLGKKNDDAEAIRLFANLASSIGAFETAETTRQDLAGRLGRGDWALADQAADLRAREGVDAAIAFLEQGEIGGVRLWQDPAHTESKLQWFRLQAERGEAARDAAIERIRADRGQHPQSAQVELLWARTLRSLGRDLDEALAATDRAIERDATLVEAHVERGRLLLESSRPDEARESFERALDLEPGHLDAAMGRADAAFALGRIDEAAALYREALIEHPWHGRAARALARIALDRGDHGDQALVWARWAARFNEGEVAASSAILAEMHRARGELEEAETVRQRLSGLAVEEAQ